MFSVVSVFYDRTHTHIHIHTDFAPYEKIFKIASHLPLSLPRPASLPILLKLLRLLLLPSALTLCCAWQVFVVVIVVVVGVFSLCVFVAALLFVHLKVRLAVKSVNF